MSSEGSVSSSGSRIRQFGLYRTIDARTEEFLRLSRKRQLRQGCACAAVSTAITVTIVISVILVYEYSINSESNPDTKLVVRSNWLGLLNDSTDDNQFDAKLTKSKLNLDRTTIKLLPILMKSLNQNRYIEKIMEDYSSSSPTYDKRETTEYNLKNDFFSDTRNWFRMHSPKLYTIEYKTSPVVYYRSPKKSSEYFTKIRKIRDYQRILNYVDKMINEKVSYSSTIPMMIGKFTQTEKPPLKQITVPIKSHKFQTVAHKSRSVVSSKRRIIKENKNDKKCNCPKKLKELINKLIGSIQKIIPTTKLSSLTACSDGKLSTKSPSKFNSISSLNSKISTPKFKLSTTTPKLAFITDTNSSYSQINYNNDVAVIQKESFYRKLINMLSYGPRLVNTYDSKQIVFTENQLTLTETKLKPQNQRPTFKKLTANTYTKATIADVYTQTTTKPTLYIDYNGYSLNKILVDKEKTGSRDFTKGKPIIPILSGDEYDDYFATTQNIINNTLDIHSLQLVKTKMLSLDKNENKINKNTATFFLPKKNISYKNISENRNNHLSNNRNPFSSNGKSTHYLSETKNSNFGKPWITTHGNLSSTYKNIHTFKPKVTVSKPLLDNRMQSEATISKPRLQNKNSTWSNIIYWNDKINKSEHNKEQTQSVDNTLLEEDIDRGNEEFQEDYRQFYNTIEKPDKNNNSVITKYKPNLKNNTLEKPVKKYNSDSIKYKFDKSRENFGTSMIPSSRPIYLEINRNDWAHDGNQDFDLNINHDLFDLPNS